MNGKMIPAGEMLKLRDLMLKKLENHVEIGSKLSFCHHIGVFADVMLEASRELDLLDYPEASYVLGFINGLMLAVARR